MATFRIHTNSKYTTINNTVFRDTRLSFKAKGLLAQMLSLPDEWDFSVVGLTRFSRDGKDSVMSALDELCKFGYLIMTTNRNEKGQYQTIYDVYEAPENAVEPMLENRCGKSDSGNPQQLNTNINTTISGLIINNNPTNSSRTKINSPQSPQGGCERNSQEDIFEAFRQIYKGSKRGLKTELENFKKKHKDWREVLPNLKTLYEQQLAIKEDARNRGCFVPQEKNLSTYLNQRCWEEELKFENNERKYISEAERARRSYQGLSNEICDFIANANLQ